MSVGWQFDSSEECETFLRNQLSRDDRQDVRRALAAALLPFLEEQHYPEPAPGVYPALVPKLRWAIQDDELQMARIVAEAACTAAGASFFLDPSVGKQTMLSALTTLAASVLLLWRTLTRKLAKLDADQTLVLMALKQRGDGLTEEELESVLQNVKPELGKDVWRQVLRQLSAFRLRDGTVVSLAQKDANSRWSAAGV